MATDSWKCVAAIAPFYGSASVPIGTSMPNTARRRATPASRRPCAASRPLVPRRPRPGVDVYRRALADAARRQRRHRLGRLLRQPLGAAELAPPISPLSGRDLIARKVKMLVAMGGGYPSRIGETNLSGDPASAQNVAANWPTKIVWSGYEVGDAVHTGQTISSVHPPTRRCARPTRRSSAPGNRIYSYDLTAVYHAVRPTTRCCARSGPGRTSEHRRQHVRDERAGNQYYLR